MLHDMANKLLCVEWCDREEIIERQEHERLKNTNDIKIAQFINLATALFTQNLYVRKSKLSYEYLH